MAEEKPPHGPTLARESRWAELDTRSLAVFRVVLGCFVILTVLSSASDLRDFFTDDGVLPREALLGSPFANDWLCLHLGTGGLVTPVVLGLLLAIFGIGLILGWHTRPMVLGCWVLLNSMQVRNPFICDRGDLELSLFLFWGFFLPLGGRWSIDAARRRSPGAVEPRGMAAVALVGQFAMIYLFAAYFKNGPFWLGRGDGLEHSLISPLFATPFSLWLAKTAAPWLTTLNYAVVAGEVFVGLLILCPISVAITRGLTVSLLLTFHVLVGLLFQLGLFPWIGALLPLALVPREIWDGIGRPWTESLDRRFGPSEISASTNSRLSGAREAALSLCFGLALASNLGTIWPDKMPAAVSAMARGLRLAQHWELFSPIPPYYGSFRLEGKARPGDEPKVIFEGPPTREEPSLAAFSSHRFRMLMAASLYPELAVIRPGLVRVLARRAGEAEPTSYSFRVRLVDERGQLLPPVTWPLWPASAQPQTAESPEVKVTPAVSL